MNADQINQLLIVLGKIADGLSKQQPYTLTGAADWPLLVVLGVGFVGLIGLMWRDLRNSISEGKVENRRDLDDVWTEMRRCQHECCPRRESK